MNNLILLNHPQGSEEWLKARLGVITASQIHALLPDSRTKSFKYKEARNTYMNQLVAEVATGQAEEINARALEWGKANEDTAIAAYEFESGNQVEKISLAYKDQAKRTGASADFIVKGQNKGGEVKNPINPIHHINFIFEEEIKPEYVAQIQFGMWVFNWNEWEFGSHQPRMKTKTFHYKTIIRDQALMEYFDNEIPKFIQEMDKKLDALEIPFGDHWQS